MIQRIIIFLVLVLTVCLISVVSLKRTSGDFDVYYDSSHNYLIKAPVYIPHGGIDEFKYSPLFALCFSPLTLIDRTSAVYIWAILNILFLYGIFYILYKLKQVSFNNFRDLLILIFLFALFGRYIFANLRLGQANVLLCYLMVLTMYFEINKRYFWAAVVLAFSLMIKFFPLLFVLYYILRGRFRLLAYTSVMIAVFLILPSVYTGFDQNSKYLHDWFVLLRSTPPVLLYSPKNYSLLSFFSWVFVSSHEIGSYLQIKKGLTPEVYYAWAISCFAFFAAFFYDTFFVKDKDSKLCFLDYACLFVCGLLFNPLAYLNALTFLMIPYFFILRYMFYSVLSKKYMFISGSLVFFSFILTMIDNKVFFRNPYQFDSFMALKPLMWSIVLVYFSLWSAKLSLKLKS